LKRVIQRYLQNELASLILEGKIQKKAKVTAGKDGLVVKT
jgi:ATP-dependent Clp protease ATP-binding subunit ClpA